MAKFKSILQVENYAKGGEVERLKKKEKQLWSVMKVKGQSRKVKSDTAKEIARVQEKIKSFKI